MKDPPPYGVLVAPSTIRSAGVLPIRSSIACCGSIRSLASASSILRQERVGPRVPSSSGGGTVIGADIAADLVAAARERAKAEGLNIEYRVADAEKLPFTDAEFDAVISTCGVMFASRPEAAAAEVARVTRRGGRVALTTWLPDSNLFKMFQVMKPYMPPPPNPAPPSPFEWGKAERVRELLGGSFDLRFERGTSFYREASGEAAWNTFSMSYGPTKALAGNLDEARRAELRRDFIAFHDRFPTELGICVPREYLLTIGVRR